MKSKHDLFSILAVRVGAHNGASVDALARQLDIMPRHVRSLVSDLRMDGIAVCGTPRTGYYIAATPEEMEETCQFLRNRAMHSLQLESRLRKIPMPDLLGQLHVPT
ncbi:MAG: hypothetical protein ACYCZT_10585 [Thiobacillus sp.]